MKGDVADEIALLGYLYARLGRKADAFSVLEELNELSAQGRYVSPVHMAWVYAGMNERDKAFAMLERGYETHAHRMGMDINTYFNFVFDPIRDDPRFKELLQKMNLEPW